MLIKSVNTYIINFLCLVWKFSLNVWNGQKTAYGCRDYVQEDCETLVYPPIVGPILNLGSEEQCNYMCHQDYGLTCKFFIYNRQEDICEVYSDKLDDYISLSKCRTIGGRKTPPLEKCAKLPIGCKVVHLCQTCS